jgi:hypothetical protein
VAGLFVAVAFYRAGVEGALRATVGLLLPLACIWFSTAFGSYVGPSYSLGMGSINRPTPALLVALGGWLLLVGAPLLIILLTR